MFEVKSTSGDTYLGGTDMDGRLIDDLLERFERQTGATLRGNAEAQARVREAAELAKIELSTSTTSRVSLPLLTTVAGKPLHMDVELTRSQLERLVDPVIQRCGQSVKQAMQDAKLTAADVDRLVLVGGPTRMPAVRKFFEDLLGRKAETGVDPMECVAGGAAIQAGVLGGEVRDIVLVDVTPLTLGVETLGGVATPLVKRNSPIPVKHTEPFSTAADMQTAVTIRVIQGERPMAADNSQLGVFNLEGILPAPRGVPKIDVTFEIDANGILDVTAKDTATGKSQAIRISGSTRLPEVDKERMVPEAERYAEEDRKRRDDAEKLNLADSLCYEGDKTLAEHADKIPEELRTRIQAALRQTREALDKKDAALAAAQTETLKAALQDVGKLAYAAMSDQTGVAAQPTRGTERGGSSADAVGGSSERVVDAEYIDARSHE